jgi:hypothetical protein
VLALALTLKLPVWSNDNDFEDSGVEWHTTAELLKGMTGLRDQTTPLNVHAPVAMARRVPPDDERIGARGWRYPSNCPRGLRSTLLTDTGWRSRSSALTRSSERFRSSHVGVPFERLEGWS